MKITMTFSLTIDVSSMQQYIIFKTFKTFGSGCISKDGNKHSLLWFLIHSGHGYPKFDLWSHWTWLGS